MNGKMQLPSLMITGGETRTTLGIVRSLGRKGIPLFVGSNHPYGRSNFSKYVKSHFSYPAKNPEAAHQMIVKEIEKRRPDVLMPVSDYEWSIVYSHYDVYDRTTRVVPNPGRELFENLCDKAYLADVAEKYGVATPRTYRPTSLENAAALAAQLSYPVLLKPRRSAGGIGMVKATTEKEFLILLNRMKEIPVIQEHITGEDLELTILCNHGEPIAGSTYLSLRNAPLPYGPPVACRSIKDHVLMNTGKEFLKKLRYHGVGHLDMRRDSRDGQPKLLDFNARLAGTNEMSTAAGIDFPHLLYLIATGETVKPCFEFEVGKEFRWILTGELRHLAQTPHKLGTIMSLAKWRDVRTDISISDPMPYFFMVLNLFRKQESNKTSKGS